MTRDVGVTVTAGLALSLAWLGAAGLRRRVAAACLLVSLAALVVAPWSIHVHRATGQFEQLIEISDVLDQLATVEPRQARVFECRYFGGLNDEQTATALDISPRTAHRDWNAGRAWLAQRLGSAD